MKIVIEKAARRLTVWQDGRARWHCAVALGRCPEGHKRLQGDGRTPEGEYILCLTKAQGKYGRSLGLNYPNRADAQAALADGRIDEHTYQAVFSRLDAGERPPWGTALGGEIYIHGGGTASDWTQGCIALEDGDMRALYGQIDQGAAIRITA